MKNVFFIIALMLTSFLANGQTTDVEIEQEKSKVAFSSFKVMLHFKDIIDMKRFQTQELENFR